MANLAARCSACGTVFRVVQDQLRVAGGLVRCGRCGEVFNATETLIDLDAEGLSAASAPMPLQLPLQPPLQLPLQLPLQPAAETLRPPLSPESEPDAGPDFDLQIVPAPAPATLAAERHAVMANAEPAPQEALGDPRDEWRAEPDDQPAFVRSANRAQRWRQPRVRATLGLACMLGLLLLAAQAGHTYRDLLAARYPQTRPALLAACQALGCRIEPARAIDSLAVESSGLVRVEKSSVYKLQVALRNHSAYAVALPAVDLTLSDSQGKVLARRVLRAAELGVTEATLAAGRELALQATLQTAFHAPNEPTTEAVAGYTIELFYP